MDNLDYLEADIASYSHNEDHPSSYLYDDDSGSRGPSFVTCKRCNKAGLVWKKTPQGWRTWNLNDNKQHVCYKEDVARKNLTMEK